jgi:5-methylcytosine-specific restriction endonuclease McrA
MAWSSSDRASRLPKDWPQRRRRVKRRANGKCEAATHVRQCNGVGRECDHIINNDDHSLANLQWLSEACHKAKTAADNARDRAARKAMTKRPTERHPGQLD